MKILSVTFENLNSLYGPHTIDFTKIPSGLFLITGKTGSGKTTILDAITLALYGATDRLGTITGGGNDLMSEGTRSCMSEVVFTERGSTWAARWEQRRTNGKKAQLQTPQRSLSENGRLLDIPSKQVTQKIVDLLGMDYARFSQAVVLAQGKFNTFLKAGRTEKASLLAEMTRTTVYRTISQKVHDHLAETAERQRALAASLEAVPVLDEEQIAEFQKRMQEETAAKERERNALKENQDIVSRWEAWNRRQENAQAIAREAENLAAYRAATDADMARLAQARRLEPLAPLHQNLAHLRADRKELEAAAFRLDGTEIPALERAKEACEAEKGKADAAHQAWEARRAALQEEIERATAIEARIPPARERAKQAEERLARMREAQKQAQAALAEADREERACAETTEAARTWLKDHAGDERLDQVLGALREKQDRLDGIRRQGEKAADALAAARAEAAQARSREAEAGKAREAAREELDATRKRIDTLRNQLAQEGDGKTAEALQEDLGRLQDAERLAEEKRSWAERRGILKPGQPCPLCGSTEHPYAGKDTEEAPGPYRDAITLTLRQLDAVRKTSSAITREEETDRRRQQAVNERTVALAGRQGETLAAEAALRRAEETAAENQKECDAQRHAIAALLEPWHLAASDRNACKVLEDRKARWRKAQETVSDAAARLADITQRKRQAEKELSALDPQSAEAEAGKARKELAELEADLAARSIPALRQAVEDGGRRDREAAAQAAEAARKAGEALATAQGRLAQTRRSLEETRAKEAEAEASFAAGLAGKGLADEAGYLEAMIDAPTRARYEAEETGRKEKESALAALRSRQEQEAPVAKPEVPQEAAERRIKDADAAIEAHIRTTTSLEEQIKADKANRARRKELQARKDEVGRELAHWKLLDSLIGGTSDHSRFEAYAQSLSFRMLVKAANERMRTLNDRYRLRTDDEGALEFSVHDYWQDAERPASTLSGGESFQVSLALALALSTFSMGRTRIDSLFLDEGFGTLDGEAIDEAVETLHNLRAAGKCVGIISHVEALKDRIDDRIVLTRSPDGRSTISGCGVSHP